MGIFVGIEHAAFDPARAGHLRLLLERLGSLREKAFVYQDFSCDGSAWGPFERVLKEGIRQTDSPHDWIVSLNDDAVPCEGFDAVLERALRAREQCNTSLFPGAFPHPICFYTNHLKSRDPKLAKGGWLTTHDGLVGVGCALSRQAAIDFLAWHERALIEPLQSSDLPINLWAMQTRRLVYTTVPSLVEHGCPETSLRGHASNGARTAIVPPLSFEAMSSIGWEHAPVVHGGRKYKGNHWRSLTLTWSTAWNVEAAYDAHRHGDPVSKHGHVMIAIPCYQDPAVRMLASLDAVTRDLREKGGLEVSVMMTPGDSLVTRGRDAILHRFMKSTANRLLFWDNDLECLMPEAVRGMLRAQERNAQEGNPGTIIGGAYPFRDGTGRIVANLGSRVPELRSDKCIEVDAVGTGFMLIHRDTVSRLMHLHPERMYIQDCGHDKDEIAWSLFASEISFGASLRDREKRRLLSEDWFFCQLWREAEGKVLLYAPAKFKHWGRHGHEGNVLDAWNVQAPKQEKTTLPSCKQKFHRMSDNALVECCLAEGHPKEIAHAWEDQVP